MRIGKFVDSVTIYLFDATTKQLVAELGALGGVVFLCSEGPSSFVGPSSRCIDEDGFAFGGGNMCPYDAGTDADADGD
jgi:hypothetical protein